MTKGRGQDDMTTMPPPRKPAIPTMVSGEVVFSAKAFHPNNVARCYYGCGNPIAHLWIHRFDAAGPCATVVGVCEDDRARNEATFPEGVLVPLEAPEEGSG
ncbi:MAG: hypothetical protein GY708_04670 [Actinomycetia bacterium]|nr:hypothetical protein [Actinomycetes bacterium]